MYHLLAESKLNSLSFIGCIWIIILSKKVIFSVDDCVVSQDKMSCFCYGKTWDDAPPLGEKCKVFEFRNSRLIKLNSSWFTKSITFVQTTEFRIIQSELNEFEDYSFLMGLKNLEYIDLTKVTVRPLNRLRWPDTLYSINLMSVPLDSFAITENLPKLSSLSIKRCNLTKFPEINKSLPLQNIDLDDNKNILITYEDIVWFCPLRSLFSNSLAGTNTSTDSEKVFCDCIRLKNWLKEFNIMNDIQECNINADKSNFTEEACSFNYSFLNYTNYDPCGRKIIGVRGVTPPWVWFLIFFAVGIIAIVTINWFVKTEIKKYNEYDHFTTQGIKFENTENLIQERNEEITDKNTESSNTIHVSNQDVDQTDFEKEIEIIL